MSDYHIAFWSESGGLAVAESFEADIDKEATAYAEEEYPGNNDWYILNSDWVDIHSGGEPVRGLTPAWLCSPAVDRLKAELAARAASRDENDEQPTPWRELRVHNEGEEWGSLGELVRLAPANLDSATIMDGAIITEWPQFILAVPGEEPDWDTPCGEVDWTGFEEALAVARGNA